MPRPIPSVLVLPCRRDIEVLASAGYALLEDVFSRREIEAYRGSLDSALSSSSAAEGAKRRGDALFAARNLGRLWPDLRQLVAVLERRVDVSRVLGPTPRLVRALFFDKPAHASWCLPWHRDTNVAVEPARGFTGMLSVRTGVPHMVAASDVLEAMISLRVHLDPQTRTNGALEVLPGSHRCPTHPDSAAGEIVEAAAGSVLLFRPLLVHRSRSGLEPAARRRVVHLEYAGTEHPAEGCSWAPVW